MSNKFSDAVTFEKKNKQERQPRYVWTASEIEKVCFRLLDQMWPVKPIRLISISVGEVEDLNIIKKDKNISEFV